MQLKKCLIALGLLLSIALSAQEEKEDYVDFGGALRFNVFQKSWEDNAKLETTLDVWRLGVDARKSGVDMSMEYRWYASFGYSMMHHAYIGYDFKGDDLYMKLGISQVPFGITKFASHSWWFQIPYYVGLEDDYDMGIKFDYTGIENLKLTVGYFRQPEFNGITNNGNANATRYSYDITLKNPANATSKSDSVSIQELNQFNIRAAYNVTENIEIGVSGQLGGIYNSELDESEMSTAFAAHVVANFGGWNFKGEYIYYNYAAKDDAGNTLDKIQMSAYASDYNVAAEASMIVAGLAYTIPVEFGPISSIQPYVDYSILNKAASNYEPTQHLIPGMMITAGNIYTYVDYAMGKNNAWLGAWTDGLADGVADPEWNTRFNINIGYYF